MSGAPAGASEAAECFFLEKVKFEKELGVPFSTPLLKAAGSKLVELHVFSQFLTSLEAS